MLEEGIYFSELKWQSDFPDAKYQLGYHSRLNVLGVGLYSKPSEQFISLGGWKINMAKARCLCN